MAKVKKEDYYFWLGEDGEASPVSEEEFEDKQEDIRKRKEDWLNVTITDA